MPRKGTASGSLSTASLACRQGVRQPTCPGNVSGSLAALFGPPFAPLDTPFGTVDLDRPTHRLADSDVVAPVVFIDGGWGGVDPHVMADGFGR